MRRTFALLLLGIFGFSLFIWRLQPRPSVGVTELVRVSDSNPLRKEQIDLYNRLHPGVHVNLDPENGVEKVIVQSLAGVGPDMFDTFDPFQLSSYVQSGVAWDITDELAKRGVNLQARSYPAIMKTAAFEGRIYGVPTNFAADALWFHRDMMREAKIPPHHGAWTWAEFIPVAQAMTTRDSSGRPIRYGFLFEWWQWRDFFAGFDANVFSPDGTRCILDDRKAVAAVTLMHDLVYKYRVSSTPIEEASNATAGGFGSGGLSVFGARHAAFALGGRWWLAQLRSYKGLEMGVMEAPYGTVRQFFGYGRSVLINKDSPHRQEALNFLIYQLGPEYNALVNAQADGISAFPEYNRGEAFLHNPEHPEETDNAVWAAAAEAATPADSSPYVSGQTAARLIQDQLDLVKADSKTPSQAMKDATANINAEIKRTVSESPDLARRYKAAMGQP